MCTRYNTGGAKDALFLPALHWENLIYKYINISSYAWIILLSFICYDSLRKMFHCANIQVNATLRKTDTHSTGAAGCMAWFQLQILKVSLMPGLV